MSSKLNKNLNNNFDVIVVGAGHAGVEAAHAAAKLGSKTLLVTLDLNKISLMPCNPSIGGVGKGHIVFEISALDGLMPKLCSESYLQARMLNTKKGPAVRGLRLQIDKHKYSKLSKNKLEKLENLTLLAGKVDNILFKDNKISGISVSSISNNKNIINNYFSNNIILTTGTFLNGLIHTGHKNFPGGRINESAVKTLAEHLKSLDLKIGRLKTGTPPRILRASVDLNKLEKQDEQELNYLYEFKEIKSKQTLPCYIAYTNQNTHKTILDHAEESPIYSGTISGKPPRYCPSIEDKITRFPDKTGHHVFIEPEDGTHEELYPSGLSTAMPEHVQEKFMQSMNGFEKAIITKPGYAVEYDYICPSQLSHSLELKAIPGLFLAGQINGTTGYEEAAGQGIIAGINASLKSKNLKPFTLSREESYIGVMIDDLVTLGIDEPYRMFTSRAERRIVLRQDNSFIRLSHKANSIGLIDKDLYKLIYLENSLIKLALEKLRNYKKDSLLLKLIGEFEFDNKKLLNLLEELGFKENLSSRALENIYAEIKYSEYIKREQKEIEKFQKFRDLDIPKDLSFNSISGLSKELQEKLNKYKPKNIAEAALIRGMTPAAISLLIFRSRNKYLNI